MIISPRSNRINWQNHHMLLALVTSRRSPDPNTQVGACIVGSGNRVLSLGYNGPPRGIAPHQMPWDRAAETEDLTKYPYVMHAEANAIVNATTNLENSFLYCTMYPCAECAKLIISSKIRCVVYLNNPYANTAGAIAARKMFDIVDIPTYQHKWESESITELVSLVSNL